MPNFIVPLVIRYFLISLAFTAALIALVALLLHFNVVEKVGSSAGTSVTFASGLLTGAYFRKREGRLAEWDECWRISTVLLLPQLVLALISLAISYAAGGLPFDASSLASGTLIGILGFAIVFGSLLNWIVTAISFRFGSKMAPRSAKGWRNLRE
ncbi:ABZJ_00895 family protein [Rhizobium daejeonense]